MQEKAVYEVVLEYLKDPLKAEPCLKKLEALAA